MKKLLYFFMLISAVVMVTSCESEEISSETIRPVRYGKVMNIANGEGRTFSGVAQSNQETNLSFKVSGRISSLPIKVGDKVKKGQLIATVEAVDYEIQLEQAKAQYESSLAQEKSAATQIESAEANLIATRAAYKRIQKLYETNSVPLSEYEQVKASYDAAQAQYDAAVLQHEAAKQQVITAEIQVKAAENQVGYTILRAPYSGVIASLNVEANELVNSGAVIGVLSTTIRPEVNVGIPEAFIAKIENGDSAAITFSAIPNQRFKGIVDEVGYNPSSSSTYPIVLRIDSPSTAIRPGMAAGVSFVFADKARGQSKQNLLIVPANAIEENGNQTFAYVLTPTTNSGEYSIAKKTVSVGKLVKKGFIVAEGLAENDLVATAGLKFLRDGMTVKLLNE